jgi:hypothetical protein
VAPTLRLSFRAIAVVLVPSRASVFNVFTSSFVPGRSFTFFAAIHFLQSNQYLQSQRNELSGLSSTTGACSMQSTSDAPPSSLLTSLTYLQNLRFRAQSRKEDRTIRHSPFGKDRRPQEAAPEGSESGKEMAGDYAIPRLRRALASRFSDIGVILKPLVVAARLAVGSFPMKSTIHAAR